jgi:hypothetical protein
MIVLKVLKLESYKKVTWVSYEQKTSLVNKFFQTNLFEWLKITYIKLNNLLLDVKKLKLKKQKTVSMALKDRKLFVSLKW